MLKPLNGIDSNIIPMSVEQHREHHRHDLLNVDIPKKKWCNNHVATAENHEGTDCLAHLLEGRVMKCPYSSADDSQNRQFPCMDYTHLKNN